MMEPHAKLIGCSRRNGFRQLRAFLASVVGVTGVLLGGVSHAQSGAPATTGASAATDPQLSSRVYESGFLVRQVSRQDPTLIVSVGGGGSKITEAQWKALESAREHIVELDVPRSHVTDSDLAKIGQLSHLKRLRLEANDISDAGIAALGNLKDVEYLNLYGNSRVSNASVDKLASMTSLKRVYLWETGITADGVKTLHAKRSDLAIDGEVGASRPGE